MFNMSDVKIETFRGKGNGGQHKNKTDSCVRATHVPTGISVTIDGRKQSKNKKEALKELRRRLEEEQDNEKAARKKERRDKAIRETETIRTYDFKRQEVTDHRTGKTAPLKAVLRKGQIERLR